MLAKVLNALVSVLEYAVEVLIGILPDSPFVFESVSWPAWAQAVGWLIPWQSIITHTSLFIGAIAIWYAVRWGMRIIRAVS